MPRASEDVDFKRLTIQVPEASYIELVAMAEASGVRRSAFFSLALVQGARYLDRSLNPFKYADQEAIGAGMVRQMTEALGASETAAGLFDFMANTEDDASGE